MTGTQKSKSTTNLAGMRSGRKEPRISSSARAEYHAVRFYESDRSLARIVADFLSEGLNRGDPGVVIATAGQRAKIRRALTDRSCDVIALERSDDLVMLDADEILSTFMLDGQPDARKFRDQVCQLVERVCRGRTDCTVRIFGQMVDVLWQQGQRDAAIRLEVLWNQLARTNTFSLLCGYAIGNFYKDAGFEDVCSQHSHIVSANGKANRIASTARDSNRPRIERRGRR